jgi:hypothetical protein
MELGSVVEQQRTAVPAAPQTQPPPLAPPHDDPPPLLVLSPNAIKHTMDSSDPQALFEMWHVFTRCKNKIANGRRLENLSWRLYGREVLHSATRRSAAPSCVPGPLDVPGLEPSHERDSRTTVSNLDHTMSMSSTSSRREPLSNEKLQTIFSQVVSVPDTSWVDDFVSSDMQPLSKYPAKGGGGGNNGGTKTNSKSRQKSVSLVTDNILQLGSAPRNNRSKSHDRNRRLRNQSGDRDKLVRSTSGDNTRRLSGAVKASAAEPATTSLTAATTSGQAPRRSSLKATSAIQRNSAGSDTNIHRTRSSPRLSLVPQAVQAPAKSHHPVFGSDSSDTSDDEGVLSGKHRSGTSVSIVRGFSPSNVSVSVVSRWPHKPAGSSVELEDQDPQQAAPPVDSKWKLTKARPNRLPREKMFFIA